MKTSEDTLRLIDALDYAESSFWDAVSEKYPEATTGDLDPTTVIDLTNHLRGALKRWLEFNVDKPEVPPKTVEIMLHRIEYYYKGGYEALLLTDSDNEHIAYSITRGISEGELCTTLDISETESKEVYGYWKINNNPE